MSLFLLSFHIHLAKTDIAQKKRLNLFLVTATEDSPICEAIGEFAKQQLGVEKGTMPFVASISLTCQTATYRRVSPRQTGGARSVF